METALQIFSYNDQEVRTVIIDGTLCWVASDVCKALSIVNVSDALQSLDEDEKLLSVLPIAGQRRKVLCVNEPGLYHLIFTSRKSEAKAFKRWVTHEVLPSIRKTGSYSSQPIVATPPYSRAWLERIQPQLQMPIEPGYATLVIMAVRHLAAMQILLDGSDLDIGAQLETSLAKGFCFLL